MNGPDQNIQAGCCEKSAKRALRLTRWVIPAAILALLPKCPACLAAYLAAWTGLSLSFSTAGYVQTSLVILCLAALAYLAGKSMLKTRSQIP